MKLTSKPFRDQQRERNRVRRDADRQRKVHRFGFRPGGRGRRQEQTATCGLTVTDLHRRHVAMSYAVPDDAFVWLPKNVQCQLCRTATHGKTPSLLTYGQLHGDHRHLMAVELLVAMLQRMWAARQDVGHRCYVNLVHRDRWGEMYDGREPAGYTFCSCDGEPKWLDARTSYCPPRLAPDRAAWEAYYGMAYEQLPGQADRRWSPSPGTVRRLLATKPADDDPCLCAPGGGDGPHAEWCDGGK